MSQTVPQMTMAEIARKAGVSAMTVSRAIRGQGRIDPETRSRIIKLATDAGYRPNSAARAMLTGRFNCVSLLLSTVDGRSTLPADTLRGIQEELMTADMHLNVSMLPDQSLIKKWGMPSALRRAMCDGLLINYTHAIPNELLTAIRRHAMPSVWLNSKQASDSVYPDDFNAAIELTQHLIAVGHRRIAYADFGHDLSGTSVEHFSVTDRVKGYRRAMSEAGLRPVIVTKMHDAPRLPDTTSFSLAMAGPARPTAVIAYGGTHASGIAYYAASHGLSIPSDLSLATFDALMPLVGTVPMTTMLLPNEQVGREAMRMLNLRIGGGGSVASTSIALTLKIGATVSPPKI